MGTTKGLDGTDVLILNPWEELVGFVSSVSNDSLTILCIKKVTLYVRRENLAKWRRRLRKGTHVGILILGDGKSIRVRKIAVEQLPFAGELVAKKRVSKKQ